MSDLEYDMADMAAASASANILNGAGQSKDNAGAKPYDFYQEATGCTNELFYRNGPTPEAVRRSDAMYVLQTVSRYLTEAYEAGRAAADSVVLSEENDRLIAAISASTLRLKSGAVSLEIAANEIVRLRSLAGLETPVGLALTERDELIAEIGRLKNEPERSRYEAQRIAEGGRL